MAASDWNANQPYLVADESLVPEVIDIAEGSTQTFKAGTPVKLSSNQIVIATDGTVGFCGIALEAASGTQTTLRKVQICRPNTRIIARVTNDGTDALANTLAVGNAYGWYIDSDSVFYVDANDASTTTVIFQQPIYDSTGASTYWGVFRVVPGQAGNIDEEAA